MRIPADIQELVDNPIETLHVKLKEWVDLTDHVTRELLARQHAPLRLGKQLDAVAYRAAALDALHRDKASV